MAQQKAVFDKLPPFVQDMVNKGVLYQCNEKPNRFYVTGIEIAYFFYNVENGKFRSKLITLIRDKGRRDEFIRIARLIFDNIGWD